MNTQANMNAHNDLINDKMAGNLRCPHCGTPGRKRSSLEVDVSLRQILYQCPNVLCGFTWKASLIFDYGISPSAQPNHNVNITMRITEKKIIDDPPSSQIDMFDKP